MTEGRLETESRCQECLAIIKGEVTSNNLSKRRVRTRTHGVVGGRGLVAPSYPISDLMLVFDWFIGLWSWTDHACMGTYYPALCLLAFSMCIRMLDNKNLMNNKYL